MLMSLAVQRATIATHAMPRPTPKKAAALPAADAKQASAPKWQGEKGERAHALEQRYQDLNRARIRANAASTRARKHGIEGEHATAEQLAALWEEFKHRCAYCGEGGALTLDHIVPLSRGGTNGIDNCAPACWWCNRSKGDRTLEEWRDGAPSPRYPQIETPPRSLLKAALAERLGRSTKQIERYVAEGMPHEGAGAKRTFPWPECRTWLDAHIRKQEEEAAEKRFKPADDSELELAEKRQRIAESRLMVLKVEQMEGSLIPLDLHEQRVQLVCETLAATIKGLGRYAGEVQRAMTDVDAELLLEKVADELLRACTAKADEVDEDDHERDRSAA
jgi:5-methylcytosine-specific restriction endonuclease McrA